MDEWHAVRAVEAGSEDGRGDHAVRQHVGTSEAAVVGLDPADTGEQRPPEVAGGVDPGRLLRGGDVGLEHAAGDSVAGQSTGVGARGRHGRAAHGATDGRPGAGRGKDEDLRITFERQHGGVRAWCLSVRGEGWKADEFIQPRLVPGVRGARHHPRRGVSAAGQQARHGGQRQAEDDDARDRGAQAQAAEEARAHGPDLDLLVDHRPTLSSPVAQSHDLSHPCRWLDI
jgi:hypothetical protein